MKDFMPEKNYRRNFMTELVDNIKPLGIISSVLLLMGLSVYSCFKIESLLPDPEYKPDNIRYGLTPVVGKTMCPVDAAIHDRNKDGKVDEIYYMRPLFATPELIKEKPKYYDSYKTKTMTHGIQELAQEIHNKQMELVDSMYVYFD